MSSRNRVLAFGLSTLTVLVGGVLELVGGDTAEQALSLSLVSLGAIALLSFVFLEVGLSEDHERQRERAAARSSRRRPQRRRRRPD